MPRFEPLCLQAVPNHRFAVSAPVLVDFVSRRHIDARYTAGADIQELAKISTAEAHRTGWLKDVEDAFAAMRKPIVAAVRGYAVSSFPVFD